MNDETLGELNVGFFNAGWIWQRYDYLRIEKGWYGNNRWIFRKSPSLESYYKQMLATKDVATYVESMQWLSIDISDLQKEGHTFEYCPCGENELKVGFYNAAWLKQIFKHVRVEKNNHGDYKWVFTKTPKLIEYYKAKPYHRIIGNYISSLERLSIIVRDIEREQNKKIYAQ
jgi:hypothetical protein